MRQSLTLIGTALTLAITANVALAESSKSPVAQSSSSSPIASTEIKLSPEGFKILCERFPLNSRCPNGQPLTPNTNGSTSVETQPSATTTTPESTTVPTSNSPESTTVPASNSPESISPAPESTTVPASNSPESISPAPETLSPNKLPDSALPKIPAIGN